MQQQLVEEYRLQELPTLGTSKSEVTLQLSTHKCSGVTAVCFHAETIVSAKLTRRPFFEHYFHICRGTQLLLLNNLVLWHPYAVE